MNKTTKKGYFKWVLLLAIGYLLGTFVPPGNLIGSNDKEFSYKTGRMAPRYLKSFTRTPTLYPEDKSDLVQGSALKLDEIKTLFNQAGESAKQFPWFKEIQDEHVFVYLTDLGNARLTIDVGGGTFTVKKGFEASRAPTLVVPLTERGVRNLVNILSDGTLTYEEQYLVYNAVAVPALQALYNTDPLYLPGDKSIFKFDDIVHVVIPPEKTVRYFGVPLSIEATAVNVDGQWLIFPGLQGDPDFKISLTLDDATKLYKEGVYNVKNLKTPAEAIELSKRFLNFLQRTTVYVRDDHR